MNVMSATLEVRNLIVEVDTGKARFPLVDGVDFSVEAGSTLAIVGESGCGKSMTAMSLMRILPEPAVSISKGEILLEGEDIAKADEARMCVLRSHALSMIFQDPIASLNPVKTVFQQIAEALRLGGKISRGEVKARVLELLRSVRLPDAEKRMHYYPHKLSGGQCQRVMIAMALARNPKILIADEPTTALDTTVQAQVMALLKKAQADTGMAVILITHNLAAAAEAAKTVAVMYAGKIIEHGPARQVFLDPRHPYTVGLLGAIPGLVPAGEGDEIGRLTEIPGVVPRPGTLPLGCAFAPRCSRIGDRCATEQPPLLVSDGERKVACFYPVGESAH